MFARVLAAPPHRRAYSAFAVPPLEDLPGGVMRPLDIGQANTYKGLPLVLTENAEPTVTAVSDEIGVVFIGMSNGQLWANKFIADLAGYSHNAQVVCVEACVPTYTLEDWGNPTHDAATWDALATSVASAGLTMSQVRVLLHAAAVQDGWPRDPYPDADSAYEYFLTNMDTFAARIATEIPSCQACYSWTLAYGGWDTTGNHKEPDNYEQGHALNTWLAANPSVGGVAHLWGPYLWANDNADGIANGSGYTSLQSHYQADGVHPSDSGTDAFSTMLHARLLETGWYPA